MAETAAYKSLSKNQKLRYNCGAALCFGLMILAAWHLYHKQDTDAIEDLLFWIIFKLNALDPYTGG